MRRAEDDPHLKPRVGVGEGSCVLTPILAPQPRTLDIRENQNTLQTRKGSYHVHQRLSSGPIAIPVASLPKGSPRLAETSDAPQRAVHG